MVAISLYKGNLHKVSDHPRKWVMPTPKISLKDFRTLLRRRSRALSRLVPVDNAIPAPAAPASDNPNPKNSSSTTDDNNCNYDVESEIPRLKEEEEAHRSKVHEDEDEVGGGDERGSEGGDCMGKLVAEVTDPVSVEVKHAVDDHNNIGTERVLNDIVENQHVKMEDEEEEEETSNKDEGESSKDKRKREVDEKLHILNEKKHGLVQVLKQILSAEEELKRRSSMQGIAVRSSTPLHVDIPNDTGSMTRLNTPRIGSDGTLIGEMEGGEPDGTSNHNIDAHHLLRMSSASPSSDSQNRKPAHNVIPHSVRTSLGVIGSPSTSVPTGQQGQRPHLLTVSVSGTDYIASSPSPAASGPIVPTGQQGQHPNLPTVSVSGTNYIASSPSPAASGGTSAFRDSRIPSPWN